MHFPGMEILIPNLLMINKQCGKHWDNGKQRIDLAVPAMEYQSKI